MTQQLFMFRHNDGQETNVLAGSEEEARHILIDKDAQRVFTCECPEHKKPELDTSARWVQEEPDKR